MTEGKTDFAIFQLGTNNWQSDLEFAPGSGILHAAHHKTYNEMENVKCWSIFPSKVQKLDREDVKVFELEHDIPICESVSPVSSYRWHTMSEETFQAYRARLAKEVTEFMAAAEEKGNFEFDLVVAHHTFLNPIVMRDVIKSRCAAGKKRPKFVVFCHGTALKMYKWEKAKDNQEEFPYRFFPMVLAEKVWDSVDGIFAISEAQVDTFFEVFDTSGIPKENVVVSPNGIDTNLFCPKDVSRPEVLSSFKTTPYPNSPHAAVTVPSNFDFVVLFVGKFANWKRLDSLLRAAAVYETNFKAEGKSVCTLVVGTGPDEDKKLYQDIASEELKLQNTYFIGPQNHQTLSKLFNIADVGVFPSLNEPMGLVFIECMACGTPVIGANSGGPKDFVDEKVGVLVEEDGDCTVTSKANKFSDTLAAAVTSSLKDEWKKSKGQACVDRANEKYTLQRQCSNLLVAAKNFKSSSM